MSLRARLLAASLVLVVLGLVAADVATYSALRSFLYNRVDAQVDGASHAVQRSLLGRGGPFAAESLRQLGAVAPGVYVQVRDANDQALITLEGQRPDQPSSSPRLPEHFALPASAGPEDAVFHTYPPDRKGGPRYRVEVTPLFGQATLIVGLPLGDTRATLRRLLAIEALVTVLVVAAAGGLGLWLVRLGLRPLADIEATAAEITAGELGRRVDRDDERTEVGRLGRALNVMLGRIDEAFAERRASEQAARDSEQRVRRFVADASHELRTPIAAVRAYAELYRMGADRHPEDLPRLLARIEEEAARMGVLVDDLLLLTRLDEGRPLDREPVDLGAVAADAVAAARVVEPDRAIELDVDGSVEVAGDRNRLRQVADNLLANVRAHTPASAPAEVSVRAEDGHAVFEVADRGPGLPDEEAGQVFERFYRADPSRSRDSGGAGLGLSIVAAIAVAHDGEASVRPREGGGSVFRVSLPLLDGHLSNGAAP